MTATAQKRRIAVFEFQLAEGFLNHQAALFPSNPPQNEKHPAPAVFPATGRPGRRTPQPRIFIALPS